MQTVEKSVLEKFKKVLALSHSPNKHEAAAALAMAQKMAEKYSISAAAVLAANVEEKSALATVSRSPATWETDLFYTVSDAFGCDGFLRSYGYGKKAEWVFIGVEPMLTIAQYTFRVLLRQIKQGRKEHLGTLKRCNRATKTKRGDLFCMGFTSAMHEKVSAFAGRDHAKAIKTYQKLYYPDIGTLNPRGAPEKGVSRHDYNSYRQGGDAGKNAQLHHGVSGQEAPLALEGGAA